ncbi:MAG: ABC transporter ATP-binding protein [Limnochordaceae bacterium]|nr:ABC transporter ATP-binding protein [Limnochordaceae bacterium]
MRRRVGILGHQPFLYDYLSAEENLRFWGRVYGVADVSRRIESLLRRLGLWVFASDPVRTYSRGMIQRLAIARALLHEPELYLLDEPFSGLDRPGVRLLVEILQELRQTGRTLLVVSHRPDEVAAVCSRFVVLARGRVVAEVPKEAAGADTGPDWVQSLEALVDQALRTHQQAGRPGLSGAPGPGWA